jgi:hypothetical protein
MKILLCEIVIQSANAASPIFDKPTMPSATREVIELTRATQGRRILFLDMDTTGDSRC